MHDLFDLAMERAALCGFILDSKYLKQVDLAPRDFSDRLYGIIFRTLQLMEAAGIAIDIATLKVHLTEARVNWEPKVIAGILNETCTTAHTLDYAARVKKLASHRRVIDLAAEMRSRASDTSNSLMDIAAYARRYIQLLEAQHVDNPKTVAECLGDLLTDFEALEPREVIPTGYPLIDQRFGAMQRSELTVLGARPGSGKTTFGLESAIFNAWEGRHVLYASLEMSQPELTKRIACMELGLDARTLRQGTVAEPVRQGIRNLKETMHNYSLTQWCPARASYQQIEGRARYQHATTGLDLLIVDHLQIIKKTQNDLKRYEHLGEVTASLKELAKELDITVLLQSQISRTEDKPTLSSLRESGDIEQNADNVWFLHRKGGSPTVDFIVAKFRHAATGELSGTSALRFGDGGRLIDPTMCTTQPDEKHEESKF